MHTYVQKHAQTASKPTNVQINRNCIVLYILFSSISNFVSFNIDNLNKFKKNTDQRNLQYIYILFLFYEYYFNIYRVLGKQIIN